MGRKRVELVMSIRETVIALLLLAGAVLWTAPEPDVREACDQLNAVSMDARIIAQHNATASQDVQKLSELDFRDYQKAASAVVAKEAAQCQDIIIRIYMAWLAHLVAACCWFAAILTLLVRIKSGWQEMPHRSVAGSKGRMERLGCLVGHMPVPGHA